MCKYYFNTIISTRLSKNILKFYSKSYLLYKALTTYFFEIRKILIILMQANLYILKCITKIGVSKSQTSKSVNSRRVRQ